MSKVIRVIVLCPNGRRETISLSPNSSILQILEESCKKQKLNPDDFDVCHYNKPLDLTLPVRFANLSNNAQLELQPAKSVRKDSLVTIGLQLESGERIMKDFVPSSSIWDVVEKCLSMQSVENLDKNGEPVCIYMRQKLIGDELKNTTLRSLGLTKGAAIIRLIYRNPEDFSDQAHISTPLTKPQRQTTTTTSEEKPTESDPPVIKQDLNSVPSNFHENRNLSSVAAKEQNLSAEFISPVSKFAYPESSKKERIERVNLKEERDLDAKYSKDFPSVQGKVLGYSSVAVKDEVIDQEMELGNDDVMDLSPDTKEEIGAIHYIGGRHAVIYSLDDITEMKKADLPDEFFELTIEDVKFLMEEYKKTRLEWENKPLLTKELRNRQMLRRLGRYKQTVIRVYFPERLVLQAVFEAEETVQDVYDFIKSYLEDPSLNFYLYTAPPKEKKDPAKSLIELMLIPAAVVYFGCDKHLPSYLMNNLRDKISDPRAASLAAYESRKQAESTEPEVTDEPEVPTAKKEPIVEEYKAPGPSFPRPSTSVQSTEKVPKWLKLSKK